MCTRSRIRSAPTFALAALLLTACSSPGEPQEVERIESLPRALTDAETRLIDGGEAFAVDFFGALAAAESPDANVFVSPLSASMALGMALAGAEGSTFEAMRSTLRLDGLTREQIGDSYRSLIELLSNLDPSVRMEIGNSLWHRSTFPLEPGYLEELRDDFLARVEGLDFSDPAAADRINAWVEESTDGLIDGIVQPPIDPLTMLFLINAIYFEGQWTTQFDVDRTRTGPFHRADGATISTPFMWMSDRSFPYVASPGYEAIELPYGGEAFAMTVVLPAAGTDLEAFMDSLDAAAWRDLLDGLAATEIMVGLPRFELEYEASLNDVLTAMGMGVAFDDSRADFTRMNPDALAMGLHISEVKQKAFVEVDEEGTRAAAVTSVEVGVTSAPPSFVADRPFLFAIRERLSGTLLFTGVVRDPSAG